MGSQWGQGGKGSHKGPKPAKTGGSSGCAILAVALLGLSFGAVAALVEAANAVFN